MEPRLLCMHGGSSRTSRTWPAPVAADGRHSYHLEPLRSSLFRRSRLHGFREEFESPKSLTRPSVLRLNGFPDFPKAAVLRNSITCAAAFWSKDKNTNLGALAEQSELANEELLLFFFQLDLTTRLQRALNLDQYDTAQEIREKMVEVEKEISKQTEAKLGAVSSKEEAQDKAITILRLRNNLQKAVEEEDYGGAATIRDQISKLEAESLAATAKALAYENVEYMFRLGQKVKHTKYGYRGVVCGMDPICSELERTSSEQIKALSRGKSQPFYQVLVDMRSEPNLLVAYVAEENLMALNEPDKDHFEHPYTSFLFYGMDGAGDFIPIKQLREKYNKPRHELPWDKDSNEEGNKDDNSGNP